MTWWTSYAQTQTTRSSNNGTGTKTAAQYGNAVASTSRIPASPNPTPPPSAIYDSLSFTFDTQESLGSCDEISISYRGGCKPYTLSASWYAGSDPSDISYALLRDRTWDSAVLWNVIAPVNSTLLLELVDAAGMSVSTDPMHVRSNGLGRVKDTWCQYGWQASQSQSSSIEAAPTDWNSSHKYAWNASDPGNAPPTSLYNRTSLTHLPMSTRSASEGIAQSDNGSIISDDIEDAHEARLAEGVLAALFAVSFAGLVIFAFLFLRIRKRYRGLAREMAIRNAASSDMKSVMTEKPRPAPPMTRNQSRTGDHLMDSRSEYDVGFALITPTGDWNQERNPFDDAASPNGVPPPRRALLETPRTDRSRLSTTSLVSDVPSYGGRSTAAVSAISTEFYHRAQTRTVPLRNKAPSSSASSSAGDSIETVLVPITRVSTNSSGTDGFSGSGNSARSSSERYTMNSSDINDDDQRSFSNVSYTGDGSDEMSEGMSRRSSNAESGISGLSGNSGFSAWGRRMMGR